MDDRFEEARLLIRLAREDSVAFRILAEHPEAVLGKALFHGQQAVEKAMKAVLSANRVIFPPTHNLLVLAKLFDGIELRLPVTQDELGYLNPYAVTVRYDDREIEILSKEAATTIVDSVLNWAMTQIPTEPRQ